VPVAAGGTNRQTSTGRERLPRRWPMGLAWVLWALTVLSLPVVVWLDQLLRQAGLGELSPLQAANLLWILAGVSAVTVGAVLASRRPSHPVGWLLLVVGLSDQSDGLISNYVHYGVMARPGGCPRRGGAGPPPAGPRGPDVHQSPGRPPRPWPAR
jgi:hypothetical protein